jgi:imidazolonepropionase
MAATLIQNIGELAGIGNAASALRGSELARMPSIKDAWLLIEGEEIADYGSMATLHQQITHLPGNVVNAAGRIVLPAWCDSHTHLVFAGSREDEFRDKIKGLSYAEIAARGGGILNSAKKLNETSEDDLFVQAMHRINEAMILGTANFEIKSGYGLTVDGELKMLRVIQRLKNACRATIKSTFLGAHAYPTEFVNNHQGYINLIINEMLPVIAAEKLADYVDVFCEKGFFTVEDMRAICNAASQYNLQPKIHANQLSASGAVEAAVNLGAISVDHLEVMNDAASGSLKNSQTIGTLLPSAAFFLQAPYQPARRLIDEGCAVALASDCNPGSSPGLNMNFVVSLACIALKMLPEEAINAATYNGACAVELQAQTGSIEKGKKADLIITKPVPSLAYLPYSFSSVLVERTIVKGEFVC